MGMEKGGAERKRVKRKKWLEEEEEVEQGRRWKVEMNDEGKEQRK